ncbi:MAG: hypothetical protein PF488_00310 [Patescibacteria group bacterium]|jgi:hypothetical protein|nr:hypothetical protein [Patescibacteria group bacterium]
MKNSKLIKSGGIHGLAVFGYIIFIVWFLNNASSWFGEDDRGIVAPVIMLSIFVFSALVTGFLILGKPIMLYLDKNKKEAIKMLFYTGLSLFIIISITFLFFSLTK